MKEAALCAIIKGFEHSKKLHGIDEQKIRSLIQGLDFDQEPFFIKIRELISNVVCKLGPQKACETFHLPSSMSEYFTSSSSPSENASESDLTKEKKKIAIKMSMSGKNTAEIALKLGVRETMIQQWIKAVKKHIGTKKRKINENEEVRGEMDSEGSEMPSDEGSSDMDSFEDSDEEKPKKGKNAKKKIEKMPAKKKEEKKEEKKVEKKPDKIEKKAEEKKNNDLKAAALNSQLKNAVANLDPFDDLYLEAALT